MRIGFICARGGSKGLPRKNLRPLDGKPLLAHAIETAHNCPLLDRVVVSTDCLEIAEVARQFGAETPFLRPAHLAADQSPEWLTWQHAIIQAEELFQCRLEHFVTIPPTSPLRTPSDVTACIELLMRSDSDIVITATESHRSPHFNMVTIRSDQTAALVSPPLSGIAPRQDAPPTYDVTTVAYAAQRDYIMNANSIFEGRVRATIIPAERALDIDSQFDLDFAEFLVNRRKTCRSQSNPRRAG